MDYLALFVDLESTRVRNFVRNDMTTQTRHAETPERQVVVLSLSHAFMTLAGL